MVYLVGLVFMDLQLNIQNDFLHEIVSKKYGKCPSLHFPQERKIYLLPITKSKDYEHGTNAVCSKTYPLTKGPEVIPPTDDSDY